MRAIYLRYQKRQGISSLFYERLASENSIRLTNVITYTHVTPEAKMIFSEEVRLSHVGNNVHHVKTKLNEQVDLC